uniref:Uncharacterized protein n=1 Tax=Arundo donax TaxID=35708 RepID=A0A0A9E8K9_ARUDO
MLFSFMSSKVPVHSFLFYLLYSCRHCTPYCRATDVSLDAC